MPVPAIATVAACGSLITAVKSSWELSRMLKRKEQEKRVESQGRVILKDLRDAYLDGYMNRKSFDKWYDRYLGAIAEKDLMELRKIREHVNLIYRDSNSHVTRRSTYPPSSSVYVDEKSSRRGRARSVDRRQSSRGPPPAYTVEEYEEERRRPSFVDTRKAQSDWYHSHTLPSPYRHEIEYTPQVDSFDDSDKERRHGRHRHHDNRRANSRSEASRSHSNSTVDRGRTRSRSVHTVTETTASSDADSEGGELRYRSIRRGRDDYHPFQADGRGLGSGRGR
ncbi:unnamed protein product [Discula destructiva]